MYYDKITELFMKKTFVTFFMFSLAALPALAASTCETRVDSHQDATTKQRVAYCLTPEAEAPAAPGPALVYYGVSGSKPAEEPKQEEEERKPVYFDKDGVAVTQQFVDSDNFPPFENDRLSVQDRLAAREMGKEEAAKSTSCCEDNMLASAQNDAWNEIFNNETAAGREARQTKPRRFMKETPAAETYAADPYAAGNTAYGNTGYNATDLSGYNDPYAAAYQANPNAAYGTAQTGAYAAQPAAANPYAAQPTQPAVPTGTPQSEVQQAYALENNPLGQPSGNAGGAAPNGYLDNNLVAGQQSFGNNATDPAMQP